MSSAEDTKLTAAGILRWAERAAGDLFGARERTRHPSRGRMLVTRQGLAMALAEAYAAGAVEGTKRTLAMAQDVVAGRVGALLGDAQGANLARLAPGTRVALKADRGSVVAVVDSRSLNHGGRCTRYWGRIVSGTEPPPILGMSPAFTGAAVGFFEDEIAEVLT